MGLNSQGQGKSVICVILIVARLLPCSKMAAALTHHVNHLETPRASAYDDDRSSQQEVRDVWAMLQRAHLVGSWASALLS